MRPLCCFFFLKLLFPAVLGAFIVSIKSLLSQTTLHDILVSHLHFMNFFLVSSDIAVFKDTQAYYINIFQSTKVIMFFFSFFYSRSEYFTIAFGSAVRSHNIISPVRD